MKNQAMTTKRTKLDHPFRPFTKVEEAAHAATHGIGALLGVVGLILLLLKANTAAARISSAVFGMSLILLYAASGTFHASCGVWGQDRWDWHG